MVLQMKLNLTIIPIKVDYIQILMHNVMSNEIAGKIELWKMDFATNRKTRWIKR